MDKNPNSCESNNSESDTSDVDYNNPDLNDILNNFNIKDDNISNMINDLSKGDIGNMMKQFTNVMAQNAKKSSNDNNTNSDDIDIENVECTSENDNEGMCNFDEMDNEDFELDLGKYFISKNGQNICEILVDIKSELVNINNSLNK
jgi:ribosomal protein L12E/L44/L45/RPP1/RPP2